MNLPGKSNFVIAISGISGAGKSTLVKSVAQAFGEATVLHFDDYHKVSTYPTDLLEWVRQGADPNGWLTPQFAQALHSLRTGQEITLPGNGKVIEPRPLIVIEEPFGRARDAMRPSIDFAAHISLPLDIALIRIINRMLEEDNSKAEPIGASLILSSLFCDYLDQGLRELFRQVDQQATKCADVILDGMQKPDDINSQLVEAIRLHLK